MNNLTHALFFVFRGKEIALVRGGEENPDEWGFPIGLLGGNPNHETIEMILKEKYFQKIAIETITEIDPRELEDASRGFVDTQMYICTTTGTLVTRGFEFVFFAKRNNISGFNLSDRTTTAFHSKFIQSRLS
ncbi:MAG: hypothetical protein Q7R72_01125 [bacterium]|nr:hypothetical protein [bacterium]